VLLQLDPVVALGEVSERDISHVTVGSEADVRLISGEIVSGTVRHVSLEATSGTRTFPIEIAIANPDRKIPAGMTAEIMIKSEAGQSGPAAALGGNAGRGRQSRSAHSQCRRHRRLRADRSCRRFSLGPGAQWCAAETPASLSQVRTSSVTAKPSTRWPPTTA
jgi:hypothetical protein